MNYQQSMPSLYEMYYSIPPCPQGADPILWNNFCMNDTDHSGTINTNELMKILANEDNTSYSLDTLHVLMSIFDKDKSGTIDFQEFCKLWKYINEWKILFKKFDTDNSGNISNVELKNALTCFRIPISERVITSIINKYGKNNEICFDKFINVCINIRTIIDEFIKVDTDRDGHIMISHDDLIYMFFNILH